MLCVIVQLVVKLIILGSAGKESLLLMGKSREEIIIKDKAQ